MICSPSSIIEETIEKLTLILGTIFRLVKPAFFIYNKNSFAFHCGRQHCRATRIVFKIPKDIYPVIEK